MTKFVTGQELEKVIYDIIWEAEGTLLIVSPFIRLDDYFMKLFDKHAYNPSLHLVIIFGKNEDDLSRSLSKDDFDYFKKFMKVSVIYVPNLHAKYYSNEIKGVITSMNLFDYSFKNNIEFGVYSETNLLTAFSTTPSHEAWEMCMLLAKNHEVVFVKRPVFERKFLSQLLGKNFIKSDILYDITSDFYRHADGFMEGHSPKPRGRKVLTDFPDELEIGSVQGERPAKHEVEKTETGYCIRTGKPIPFNPSRPFSINAYYSWAEYGNMDYPENYCHKTGKPSYGRTSMRNPILK